jgi:hypothetical protein
MILAGAVASSGGISALIAEVLVVNGGGTLSSVGSTSWIDAECGRYRTQNGYVGGSGGRYGINSSYAIANGESYVVVVGAANSSSTINSVSNLDPSFTSVGPLSNGANSSYTWFSGCVGNRSFNVGGGGGGASSTGTASSGRNPGNGGAGVMLASFGNVQISGGGGGANLDAPPDGYVGGNTPAANFRGTDAPSTYGGGQGTRSAQSGVVIFKYPDTFSAPISGTFTESTSGGYRYITCTASSTLVWA